MLKHNKKFIIIDKLDHSSASRIATGVINPISGQRLVPNWRLNKLCPFAQKYYAEIEDNFREIFFNKLSIIKLTNNKIDLEKLKKLKVSNEYSKYLINTECRIIYDKILNSNFESSEILGSHCDTTTLLDILANEFKKNRIFKADNFYYENLILDKGKVCWKNFKASNIVFCEGPRAVNNPWFSKLPFENSKGEVLTLRLKGKKHLSIKSTLFKNGKWLMPVAEQKFMAGSTYCRDFLDNKVTNDARTEIINGVEKFCCLNFAVVLQQAAIRPTVKDHLPIIGSHKLHSQISIFNGLASKGVYFAPYCAVQLANNLIYGNSVERALDVNRFIY